MKHALRGSLAIAPGRAASAVLLAPNAVELNLTGPRRHHRGCKHRVSSAAGGQQPTPSPQTGLDRDGSNALLSYDIAKGPELENPLDPSSKSTDNTRYVLSEVYESPAGVDNHWRQAQESWSDFGAMVEMLASCNAQTLHGGSIAQSLW